MCLIMKHIRMGRPAICPYSATMLPNPLQGLVAFDDLQCTIFRTYTTFYLAREYAASSERQK